MENLAVFASSVAVLSAISNIYFSVKNSKRTDTRDTAEEARRDAYMQASIDHIRNGIDELRLAMKDQNRQLDGLGERVTRLEEATKSLHKRVDRMEGKV